MSSIGWALLIVFYTAVCAIWSGLFTLGEAPPAGSPSETVDRWLKREARRTRRVWIWQAGLALIMIAWACDRFLLSG